MKIKYEEHKFNPKSLALIESINSVITEYLRQGYDLTLRQTYYQLVARGFTITRDLPDLSTGTLSPTERGTCAAVPLTLHRQR